MQQTTARDSGSRGNNILVWVAGAAAAIFLFFFFTAGIPFIQAGFWETFGESKKQYVKIARLSIAGLGLLLVFLRWKTPAIFERLWLVRFVRYAAALPLPVSLTILFILYGVTMSSVSILRHLALETRAFDLGIFAQAVWTTLHGDFLFSSIKENICLMGDHVSPLLAVLALPYALWPDPRLLLVLQAFAAGACLYPLTQIIQNRFAQNTASSPLLPFEQVRQVILVFAVMYFFFMPTRAAVHEDFHPEVLVEPLMLFAFLWLERGKGFLFLAALAIVLSAKENMSGLVFAFGLYALLFKKRRILGLVLMVFSVGYLIFCTRWVVPALSGEPYLYAGSYQHLAGGGAAGIMSMLSDGERWEYLFKVYLPFFYLPFLHPPTLLLTLPVLTQNLLSRNGVTRSFNYHYLTGLTPFLFVSSVYALAFLRERFSFIRKHFQMVLWILLSMGLIRAGAPEYFYGWQSVQRITERTQMIRDQMSRIPQEAVLLTHNNLIPQAVNRKFIYQFDYNSNPTKTQAAVDRKAAVVVMDETLWEPGTRPFTEEAASLQQAGYKPEFARDGFHIFVLE